ncbi:MAB_1171c family putative transporter [Streptomyces sp. NPDC004684]
MTSGASSPGFYACGILIFSVCAMKVPALIRRRHDALLRAACLLLFAAGWTMVLGAPESIVVLNRLTGITNLAAPVVYATTTVFSGASLLLIVNWRPAPPERTRNVSRLVVRSYSAATLAVIVLFLLGDAPTEQLTLFDVFYADTPFIREMILTYLLAQGVATMAASTLCWKWSKEVQGSLRAGLRILAPAYLLIVCYDAMRLVAVCARWTGRDLDFLVDRVSPQLAALSCVLGAIGFAVPLAAPHVTETVQAVRQLRQLTPLWRVLEQVPTPAAARVTLPWWRTRPAVLLTGRKTALYDAILALTPYCDPAVHQTAYRIARRHQNDAGATATADAAMLLAARERQRTHPERMRDGMQASAWRGEDLVRLSLAFTSPLVHVLAQQDRAPQRTGHHD